MDLIDRYNSLRDKINVRLGEMFTLKRTLADVEQRLSSIDKEVEQHDKASVFLQSLSDETRRMIIDKISGIVTDALKKVLDPDLEFKMLLTTERNQVDIKFVVKDSKLEKEYDILNSYGGGIADVITFPLKVSLLMKWNPALSKVIILDESFAAVDAVNREALGEFIRQLADKLGLQVILVTHGPELEAKAHKTFTVSKSRDVSSIQEK